MSKYDSLIKSLEALEGPDREVDCEIALALHGGEIVWKQAQYTGDSYPYRKYKSADHVGGYGSAPVERYTQSIDAASTTVPKDMIWFTGIDDAYGLPGHARINDAYLGNFIGQGKNPAIALCLAAFYAREKLE